MKTIGLLGGMSWESSAAYYRTINQLVRDKLGGMHSAKCIMHSVDFAEIEGMQSRAEWDALAPHVIENARVVERVGADLLLLCCNTVHVIAEQVQAAIDIPLLHIADTAGQAVRDAGLTRVGILGSRYTVADEFFPAHLRNKFNLSVTVASAEDNQFVDRVIYYELCRGKLLDASRDRFHEIIANLASDGAEGVILACTEIGLLIKPQDSTLPAFDTTVCHAEAAVEIAIGERPLPTVP